MIRFAQNPAFALLLVTALIIAGCSTPKRDTMAYRNQLERSKQSRINVKLPTSPNDPVTLEQCYALAIDRNETLALSGEDYALSLIAKDRVASTFLPSISIGASRTEQEKQPSATVPSTLQRSVSRGVDWSLLPSTSLGGNRTVNRSITPAITPATPPHIFEGGSWDGSWNIFNGFSDFYRMQISKLTIEQQQELLRATERSLLLDIAEAFYAVLLSEKAVEIIESTLQVQQESLREVEAREKAGVARKLDVYQTEAQNANFRGQLISAELNVYNARQLLSFLIDHPVQGAVADEMDVPEETRSLDELMQEAEETRHDLKAAAKAVQAAEKGIRVAYGGFFPSVSVSATNVFHQDPGSIATRWTNVLSLSQPIFRGGQTMNDIREAHSALRQTELSKNLLERGIRQEVAVNRANLIASTDRIEQLKIELRAAQEALRQAKAQYKVGLSINLDVIAAQAQVLETELQLQTEVFQRKLEYVTLRRSLGHFPLPPVELNIVGDQE